MKFLLRSLPTLLIVLLISGIYYGGKAIYTFIQEHPEEWAAANVTQNQKNDSNYGNYAYANTNNDVNNSDFDDDDSTLNGEDDIDYSNFEDDVKDIDTDSPEATLDAELEGKSSNQLLASNLKKRKIAETKSSSSKKKRATSNKTKSAKKSGSSKSKTRAKINKKSSMDRLAIKGGVPNSYGYNSNQPEQFLVIAGSFKSKANANLHIDNLETKGLRNLEIIELRERNLNRVCVSRHSTYDDAKQTIKMLKRVHNVDSYVHTKSN